MTTFLSNTHLPHRMRLLAFDLVQWGVCVWMKYPALVMSVFISSLFISGGVLMLLAFSMIATGGTGSGLFAAAVVLASIALFAVVIEPWLANTGLEFRPRHQHKAQMFASQECMDYLRLVHDRMMSLRSPCHVSILSGRCPWLLAYGIEHIFDPAVRASIDAMRLNLSHPLRSSRLVPSKPPQRRL